MWRRLYLQIRAWLGLTEKVPAAAWVSTPEPPASRPDWDSRPYDYGPVGDEDREDDRP